MQASEAPPCPKCGSPAKKTGERRPEGTDETIYSFQCSNGHVFTDTVKDADQDSMPE
jgi:hypothetical protein